MEVITTITVPSYVYRIYMKIAEKLGGYTAEDIMSEALNDYAGYLADEIQQLHSKDIREGQ